MLKNPCLLLYHFIIKHAAVTKLISCALTYYRRNEMRKINIQSLLQALCVKKLIFYLKLNDRKMHVE